MEAEGKKRIDELASFLGEPPVSGKLIFGSKESDGTELHSASLLRETVKDYADSFAAEVRNLMEEEWCDYGSDDVEPGPFRYLSVEEVPYAKTYFSRPVIRKDKLEESFIESISYTEFRFENSKRQVCSVFKVYPRTKFLASNNKFKFTWVDSVLTPIEKSLVIIQPEIDCVLFNEYVYVVEWSRFESIFDYEKHLVAAGEKVFEFVERDFKFRIDGLEEMKEKCMAKQRYRRKLAYIAKMLPLKDVKYEDLREFCNRMKLDDPVFNPDDKSLRFNDVRAFLQLMADDILSSGLTSADYIASSKRRFISASGGS